jgi:hypothetical protein
MPKRGAATEDKLLKLMLSIVLKYEFGDSSPALNPLAGLKLDSGAGFTVTRPCLDSHPLHDSNYPT